MEKIISYIQAILIFLFILFLDLKIGNLNLSFQKITKIGYPFFKLKSIT